MIKFIGGVVTLFPLVTMLYGASYGAEYATGEIIARIALAAAGVLALYVVIAYESEHK